MKDSHAISEYKTLNLRRIKLMCERCAFPEYYTKNHVERKSRRVHIAVIMPIASMFFVLALVSVFVIG